MGKLQTFLKKKGLTYQEFQDRRAAYYFYGEDVEALNRDIEAYNRGQILICQKCRKVDIDPITHHRDCDPLGEYERQQAQAVCWK